jgi:hypothetical protein
MTHEGDDYFVSSRENIGASPIERRFDVAGIKAAELQTIAKFEIKPTPEDELVISKAKLAVERISTLYNPNFEFVPQYELHLLFPGGTFEASDGECRSAFCNRLTGVIGIDRSDTPISLALRLAHELFHLAGGSNAQIDVSQDHRDAGLEEGVVCELEEQAYQILKDDSLFAPEIALTEEIKHRLEQLIPADQINQNLLAHMYAIPLADAENILSTMKGPKTDDYKVGYVGGRLSRLLEEERLTLRGRLSERESFEQRVKRIQSYMLPPLTRHDAVAILLKAFLTRDSHLLANLDSRFPADNET